MLSALFLSLCYGALIGLGASWLMLSLGRIAGVSGIIDELIGPLGSRSVWRFAFLLGLFAGGVTVVQLRPDVIAAPSGRSIPLAALSGLLVGYGARLANGCTSGHAICGISRRSSRSLIATVTFMAAAFVTATLFGLAGGGS